MSRYSLVLLMVAMLLAACGKREVPQTYVPSQGGKTPVITNQGTIECR
jgi:uncharacterized lipoprotein YehR (DUF1307 family)